MARKEKWCFQSKWFSFWFQFGFRITFEICGYFDNRPQINLNLFFFYLVIHLPFRNSWESECDPPEWGIAYNHHTIFIHTGGKGNMNGGSTWIAFDMPWQYQWVRTSLLLNNQDWAHDTKETPKSFYKEEWKQKRWQEVHPYKYVLKSGEVQLREATISVEEREWRMRALKWTSLFNKVSKTISVEFNGEVGEGTGSWKGGTVGCGWELLPNETPRQCLNRMEMEREFN